MRNTNMRRGFTMIELIFVIVIIGILAAVAIPKLAATRDDAEASTCIHEVGQLIQEMSASYTKLGNALYTTTAVDQITNIQTAVTGQDNGITNANTTQLASATAINYNCGGGLVAVLTGTNAGVDFNLSVVTTAVAPGTDSPATAKVKAAIFADVLNGSLTKIYKL